ncbi:MAG: O-antigen ligase family protein [Prevotella sp.]|nr:O-antigen ligase family protein [Prevotella sp.]
MTNSFATYSKENGGRVLLLFLLFLLAIYQFITAGFNAFAIICLIPLAVPIVYAAFNWQMLTFWVLIFTNYFLQFLGKQNMLPQGIPMSIYNELLEIILLLIAIVDARQAPHFERTGNLMLISILAWCGFCTLEVLNDTCNLGIDVGGWYTGARMMAFQLLYAFLIFTLYITTPERLLKYLKIWAILSLFSVYWTWQQQHIGFTAAENIWMETLGRTTHMVNGITRYFSTFSDAANYGCNASAAAVAFYVLGITSKIKKDKYFFLITGLLVTWGMFASGTRTAMFCLIAGFAVFIVLSKSFKIAIPVAIVFGFFMSILIFTDIGQGNSQIRRMRSAFNKDDASANVRDINQAAIKKYIADAPWGLGLGVSYDNVPANNKYKKLSTIPPDSEYVFIWVHTGPIGITTFVILTIIMFLGGCWVVFTKIKNRSLMGVGAGLCGAFAAIQLGGYGNQVLMQFPNCLIFYGGLAIVYILPYIEPAWVEMEEKRFAEQEEKKRLKLEKKLASRV